MARFDPNCYPDRLAFEAYARRIRADELAKAHAAVAAWLEGMEQQIASRLTNFATAASTHLHRRSTH